MGRGGGVLGRAEILKMTTHSCYQSVKPVTTWKSSGSSSGTCSGKYKKSADGCNPKTGLSCTCINKELVFCLFAYLCSLLFCR